MDTVSALPSKWIYRWIMQDYNLLTAICELIDNVIDNWQKNNKKNVLVDISFDIRKSLIVINDNSWWVENLELVIAPWKTWNSWDEEVIWIFWIWSKRAAIAISSHIKFRTFYDKPLYITYDDKWLEEEDNWNLNLFDDVGIEEWNTIIELSQLRIDLNKENINDLEENLGFIYWRFLIEKKLCLKINWKEINWTILKNWWEYSGNKPKTFKYNLNISWTKNKIKIEITAWIKTATSSSGEYWVYFYWNDRLISREVKDKEVWYYTWKAWQPHPAASLWQFIVNFYWPSNLIPWTSSKNWINYSTEIYKEIWELIENIVCEYTKLSRNIVSNKDINNIIKYNNKIEYNLLNSTKNKDIKIYLPSIPKKLKEQNLIKNNKEILKNKPWCEGLIDSFIAVEKILKINLVQKNRISFIILDSNFEIWLKEYLVNEKKIGNWPFNSIKDNRHKVIQKIRDENIWNNDLIDLLDSTNFYYNIRNNLIHQKATPNIWDNEIKNYEKIIEKIFVILFWLNFN